MLNDDLQTHLEDRRGFIQPSIQGHQRGVAAHTGRQNNLLQGRPSRLRLLPIAENPEGAETPKHRHSARLHRLAVFSIPGLLVLLDEPESILQALSEHVQEGTGPGAGALHHASDLFCPGVPALAADNAPGREARERDDRSEHAQY